MHYMELWGIVHLYNTVKRSLRELPIIPKEKRAAFARVISVIETSSSAHHHVNFSVEEWV